MYYIYVHIRAIPTIIESAIVIILCFTLEPDSTDATDSEKTKLRDDYTEEDSKLEYNCYLNYNYM